MPRVRVRLATHRLVNYSCASQFAKFFISACLPALHRVSHASGHHQLRKWLPIALSNLAITVRGVHGQDRSHCECLRWKLEDCIFETVGEIVCQAGQFVIANSLMLSLPFRYGHCITRGIFGHMEMRSFWSGPQDRFALYYDIQSGPNRSPPQSVWIFWIQPPIFMSDNSTVLALMSWAGC